MKMVFDADEVAKIVRAHLKEKLMIPDEAIQYVTAEVRYNNSNSLYELNNITAEITTEDAVPAGPYRTNAKPAT